MKIRFSGLHSRGGGAVGAGGGVSEVKGGGGSQVSRVKLATARRSTARNPRHGRQALSPCSMLVSGNAYRSAMAASGWF
jgi:hypothetical protein